MQSAIGYNNAAREYRVYTSKEFTLTGNNYVPVFRITGNVLVKKLYAVVTTVLETSHGHSRFVLNDQTARTNITAPHDTFYTNLPVGSTMEKMALAATIVNVTSSAAGVFEELVYSNVSYYQEFKVTMKSTESHTDIEYFYNTPDDPAKGIMQFFCVYVPFSADAAVTAL